MDFFSRSRRVGETEGSRYIGRSVFPEELVNFLRFCSGEYFAAETGRVGTRGRAQGGERGKCRP